MPARIQTLDWLNAELDKTEAAIAEVRRQLEEAKDEIAQHDLWREEAYRQLAASRERERKMAERFLIHEREWDSRPEPPSQASAEGKECANP